MPSPMNYYLSPVFIIVKLEGVSPQNIEIKLKEAAITNSMKTVSFLNIDKKLTPQSHDNDNLLNVNFLLKSGD